MLSVPGDPSHGAARGAGKLLLAASAQEHATKQPPAVLRLWARAKAIPGEVHLAFNRFPTRCIRHYHLERTRALNYYINRVSIGMLYFCSM